MIYKMFDKVLMKDGRSASIVEVYGNGDEYDVDVDIPEEGSWETKTVHPKDIVRKLTEKEIKAISEQYDRVLTNMYGD